MSRDISSLSVIVTGGARGIGRAIVERLTAQGARVAIGDRDIALAQATAQEIGRGVVAAHLDVTDAASWAGFLGEVESVGPFDVLVNNAGIMPIGSLLKEPEEVTRRIVDINLHGVINGTKAVAPGMIERGHGHIVNIASVVGRYAVANGASYTASKFAVVGLSESLRAELAPQGIDVSLVLPSIVKTELSAGVPDSRGVKPVTADDVAKVVEATIRKPKDELWVPRYSKSMMTVTGLLPKRLQLAIAKAMKADSVFADADSAARAAYEQRARES